MGSGPPAWFKVRCQAQTVRLDGLAYLYCFVGRRRGTMVRTEGEQHCWRMLCEIALLPNIIGRLTKGCVHARIGVDTNIIMQVPNFKPPKRSMWIRNGHYLFQDW